MEHKNEKNDEIRKSKIIVCREFGDKKLIDILADLIAKRIKSTTSLLEGFHQNLQT